MHTKLRDLEEQAGFWAGRSYTVHFNLNAFRADLSINPWDAAFVYDNIDNVWAHWSRL